MATDDIHYNHRHLPWSPYSNQLITLIYKPRCSHNDSSALIRFVISKPCALNLYHQRTWWSTLSYRAQLIIVILMLKACITRLNHFQINTITAHPVACAITTINRSSLTAKPMWYKFIKRNSCPLPESALPQFVVADSELG